MTWELALQSMTVGVASLGSYFVFDLIKEFKEFKKQTSTDVSTLKIQRSGFESTIRNAEMSIGLRVNEMQKLHNDFSLTVKSSLIDFKAENKTFKEFMTKSLELSGMLNERVKEQEQELKHLKLQLKEIMIFKSSGHKNGK